MKKFDVFGTVHTIRGVVLVAITAASLLGGEKAVQLETTPAGAQVELNGSVVCAATPCSIKVPDYYFVRKHTAFSAHADQPLRVRFTKDGFVPKTMELSTGPHRWKSLNNVNQYDYYLLTTDKFTFQLDSIQQFIPQTMVKHRFRSGRVCTVPNTYRGDRSKGTSCSRCGFLC